jgi:hypothetical protein
MPTPEQHLPPVPRNPGYTDGLSRKQRYRQRLKLQRALVRVLEVVCKNDAVLDIQPDQTTGEFAHQVIACLASFVKAVGIDPTVAPEEDFSRYLKHVRDRREEGRARFRRKFKKMTAEERSRFLEHRRKDRHREQAAV